MKNFSVKPGPLPSTIYLPSSKSYANRALILAALREENIVLKNLSEATDVTFLIQGLREIGLDIQLKGDEARVVGQFPQCEKDLGATINVGEGGTTARFLACLLLRGSAPYKLILGNRLKDRPWDEFMNLARELGAQVSLTGQELFIQGPIQPDQVIDVDCSRTTQYASGLQLAYAFESVTIQPRNLESSLSYWKMTQSMIDHFKVHQEYVVPLDWSSASYPLAFGALRQNIFFPGLFVDPFQADSKYFQLLQSMQAIDQDENGITVTPGIKVKDVLFDCSDCLDLVPTLAFYLAHIEGHHELKGIQNLVHKESDRLHEIVKLLSAYGIQASTDQASLWIQGQKVIHTQERNLKFPEDHRLVMMGALFLRLHGGGSVEPAHAVSKSFTHFFELLSKN